MSLKVCKFGGTSLTTATQFLKVEAIVRSDEQRRYIVPSAPGIGPGHDQKVTDLLYLCHDRAQQQTPFDDVFQRVTDRYQKLISQLGMSLDLARQFELIKEKIVVHARNGELPDYAASRGEYLNAQILANLLGFQFIDAVELIYFDEHNRLDERKTYDAIIRKLAAVSHAVVPGFYGRAPGNRIKTFSRGGSDVTGAIVARGVSATVYENWTDVSGLLMADPRVVDKPQTIDVITYRELRELAYMGATVLHEEAIFPVRETGIPVQIRNTNRPDDAGTTIVAEAESVAHRSTISGIAGRKDFTVFALEKELMNTQIGFGRRLLGVFEDHGVSYEHSPSGIDTMSVVVADSQIEGKLEHLLEAIRMECEPDSLEVYPDMALIATVGRGMANIPGVAARLFSALADAGVNIRMIDQGSSELNIIVGVEATDFEKAVLAIYNAFVK